VTSAALRRAAKAVVKGEGGGDPEPSTGRAASTVSAVTRPRLIQLRSEAAERVRPPGGWSKGLAAGLKAEAERGQG
jgi:hypothetical protein